MKFRNSYKTALTAPGVLLKILEPNVHARPLYEAFLQEPDTLAQWIGISKYDSFESWRDFLQWRCDNDTILPYAVFDTSGGGEVLAGLGLFGFLKNNRSWLGIVILRAFQGTHVAKAAATLLLHVAFDRIEQGGCNQPMVSYRCCDFNVRSKRFAERLGFRFESKGLKEARLDSGCLQLGLGLGDSEDALLRDYVYLALTQDEWQEVVAARLDRLIGLSST